MKTVVLQVSLLLLPHEKKITTGITVLVSPICWLSTQLWVLLVFVPLIPILESPPLPVRHFTVTFHTACVMRWFIIHYSHSVLLPKLSQSLYLFPILSRARYSGYISCEHSLKRKGSSFLYKYKYKARFSSQNLKQRLEISHHANRL